MEVVTKFDHSSSSDEEDDNNDADNGEKDDGHGDNVRAQQPKQANLPDSFLPSHHLSLTTYRIRCQTKQ